VIFLVFGAACLSAPARAAVVPLIYDRFDAYVPGTQFENNVAVRPTMWATLTQATGGAASATVITDPSNPSNQVLDVFDNNADTKWITVYHYCKNVVDGTFWCQFDVMLPQTSAGFLARLNYAYGVPPTGGNQPNNGRSWAAGILFQGGSTAWPGTETGGPGRIAYQTKSFTQVYVLTSAIYSANTWYTVKFLCDVVAKKYQVFFGPRGGALAEITPAGGVPFIIRQTDNYQVNQLNCISFASSDKTSPDTAGHMYVDNVQTYGDQTNHAPRTVLEAKQLPAGISTTSPAQAGAYLQTYLLSGRVASVGTDQLGRNFFYLQDSTGGIRVRQDPLQVTVRQGDKVDISGWIQRASDNGIATRWEGEKEILAVTLDVIGSNLPVPRAVGMKNRSIGGDNMSYQGTTEPDGFPSLPGVYAADGGSGYPPPFIREAGPNNVGIYGRFWGKVTYIPTDSSQPYYPYFYLDDGSGVNDGSLPDGTNPQVGVRVLLRKDRAAALASLAGKYVVVTGVVGAISASDLLPNQVTNNVRVIRAAEEPFTDSNGNGLWDVGESFVDSNGNGSYDGIQTDFSASGRRGVWFDSQGTAMVFGRRFFPIGVYLYDFSTATEAEVLRQGFNTVIFAVTPNDLGRLHADNLMTIPYPTPEWMAVKDDPSILAWYLYDEPEGWGIAVETAHAEYLRVKGLDPYHPAGMSHFLWDALYNYRDSEDFVMSDVYPIHKTNITALADHLVRIHAIHGDGYPAWPVIQAFGGTEGWDVPTPEEERLMVYLALVHGAKAMLFFSFRPQHVELWAEVKRLIAELKQLTPFFVLPSTNLAVSWSDSAVRARAIQVGNSGLVIATNTSYSGVTSTITIPALPVSSLSLPFEGGSVQVVNGQFSASFAPLGVHIYQWGPTPAL